MKQQLSLLSMIALFIFSSWASQAAETEHTLRNFVPGNYSLTQGEMHLCGEGDFSISEDGARVWLGPYYQFRMKEGVVERPGGLPMDKGCIYRSVTKVDSKGRETILTDTTTLLCGKKERQVITNEAKISKLGVTFEQTATVDKEFATVAGGAPHQCAWKKKK